MKIRAISNIVQKYVYSAMKRKNTLKMLKCYDE